MVWKHSLHGASILSKVAIRFHVSLTNAREKSEEFSLGAACLIVSSCAGCASRVQGGQAAFCLQMKHHATKLRKLAPVLLALLHISADLPSSSSLSLSSYLSFGLSVCLYVYVYIHIHVYICIPIHAYIRTYVRMYIHTYMHTCVTYIPTVLPVVCISSVRYGPVVCQKLFSYLHFVNFCRYRCICKYLHIHKPLAYLYTDSIYIYIYICIHAYMLIHICIYAHNVYIDMRALFWCDEKGEERTPVEHETLK